VPVQRLFILDTVIAFTCNMYTNSNCRPVLVAEDCVEEMLSSSPQCQFAQPDHPKVTEMREYLALMQTAVNFVCRDNVEGLKVAVILCLSGLIQVTR